MGSFKDHLPFFRSRPPGAVTPPARPVLEIQYHPADIRRGVRYFFLTRRRLFVLCLVLTGYLAVLALSLAISPTVLGNRLAKQQYRSLVARRLQLGEEVKNQVAKLEQLQAESDELGLEMSKIYLAYGFSDVDARGQGGYPFAPAAVPESIYANDIRRGNGLMALIGEQLAVLEAFHTEVTSFEMAHRDQVRTTPSICPLRKEEEFVLTSPFANRRNPFTKAIQFHAGVDFAAPVGKEIHAPADGVVAYAGLYSLKQSVAWSRYGRLVALRHGEHFVTLFGHCDEIRVRAGQRVKQGEVIATVGNTGWSTNPHLHYEIRRRNDEGEFVPVDPRIYILDHRWRDEERLLVRTRSTVDAQDYEPLPSLLGR